MFKHKMLLPKKWNSHCLATYNTVKILHLNFTGVLGFWGARVSPFRKVGELSDEELEIIYKSMRALMWGDYAPEEARKKGYIGGDFKIPHDYGREFFVYRQEIDIEGRKVVKEELYEGSQKRFIYWVKEIQV